jgi:uncharacterized protein with HEPN domain
MSQKNTLRLAHLLSVATKEVKYLQQTTDRLLTENIDAQWVETLETNQELAERVDAFVARFGRLQDNLGDKLIPELLRQMLETPKAAIDNLNRMEKLGMLSSMTDWIEARNLRNRLVHEYIDDNQLFSDALNRALALVSLLTDTQEKLNKYALRYTENNSAN